MRLGLLIVMGVWWPAIALAFTADKRDTLRGLTEVAVLVEYLPDDLEREGLKREQLKHDIEIRLKEAGLRVLTTSEIATTPGAPYLYAAVYAIAGPATNGHVYAVTLALKQLVQLSRNPATELFATTWEGPAMAASFGAGRATDIRDRFRSTIERFLIDYQAVNTK